MHLAPVVTRDRQPVGAGIVAGVERGFAALDAQHGYLPGVRQIVRASVQGHGIGLLPDEEAEHLEADPGQRSRQVRYFPDVVTR